jgi:HD-GYP domain-containing protein (c-di-GMP phosphodiesterase class II)
VLAHHERPDGLGYPRGLKAEAIPLEARIVAVADAYESMTSERPYRSKLSHVAAQAELTLFSGRQFDRRVVDAFLRTLEREGVRERRPPAATG